MIKESVMFDEFDIKIKQKERDVLQQDLTGIWTFLMDRFEVLANAILDLKNNGDLDPETIKQLKKIGDVK